MEDIFIRYLDMPTTINGMATLDENGDYNIYINPRHSYDMQNGILEYELKHVVGNDSYNEKNIKDKDDID